MPLISKVCVSKWTQLEWDSMWGFSSLLSWHWKLRAYLVSAQSLTRLELKKYMESGEINYHDHTVVARLARR